VRFPETSIENLLGFGYTEDEARFLYLVATPLWVFLYSPVP